MQLVFGLLFRKSHSARLLNISFYYYNVPFPTRTIALPATFPQQWINYYPGL